MLHSERPKLYRVLAVLSAIGLKTTTTKKMKTKKSKNTENLTVGWGSQKIGIDLQESAIMQSDSEKKKKVKIPAHCF